MCEEKKCLLENFYSKIVYDKHSTSNKIVLILDHLLG